MRLFVLHYCTIHGGSVWMFSPTMIDSRCQPERLHNTSPILCIVYISRHLLITATDTFHTLLVYRWETADLVADSRAHTEEVYVVACNPFNERSLVMCGRCVVWVFGATPMCVSSQIQRPPLKMSIYDI